MQAAWDTLTPQLQEACNDLANLLERFASN